jgi:hypothetical protein
VIYLTVWRARPRHRQALELPIIKGGQHATSVCRYARDPAHRVFGDSAKVRVWPERTHEGGKYTGGNLRSDRRRFNAVGTALLIKEVGLIAGRAFAMAASAVLAV